MINVNINKAKEITHDKRRAKRTEEFAPLDIQATIPAMAAEAEAQRQVIRDKYDAMQTTIDNASSPEELKAVIESEGL